MRDLEVVFAGFLIACGVPFWGSECGPPNQGRFERVFAGLHRSAYRWWVAFQCPPLTADNTDGPSQAEKHSAWSEDSGSEAEEISVRQEHQCGHLGKAPRGLVHPTWPSGAWVPGTREEVPDRGGSLELEANVRQR